MAGRECSRLVDDAMQLALFCIGSFQLLLLLLLLLPLGSNKRGREAQQESDSTEHRTAAGVLMKMVVA